MWLTSVPSCPWGLRVKPLWLRDRPPPQHCALVSARGSLASGSSAGQKKQRWLSLPSWASPLLSSFEFPEQPNLPQGYLWPLEQLLKIQQKVGVKKKKTDAKDLRKTSRKKRPDIKQGCVWNIGFYWLAQYYNLQFQCPSLPHSSSGKKLINI